MKKGESIMKKQTLIIIASLIFVVFISSSIYADELTKKIEKSITVKEGAKLKAENINGDIVLNCWDNNYVNIKATIVASKTEDLERISVDINKIENDVKVEVRYSEDHYDNFWSFIRYLKNIGKHGKANVNIDIKVPKNMGSINLETVNGDINIKDTDIPLRLETVNGEIEAFEVSKLLKAETVNGSIEISIKQLNDDIDLETVNGRIKIYLPADVKADISAENINGSIKTDFPLIVSGEIIGKNLKGKIGGGGTKIRCETVNGSIYILKK